MCGTRVPYLSDVRKWIFNDKSCAILEYFFNSGMYLTLPERPSHKTYWIINSEVCKMGKFLSGTEKQGKNQQKWVKMA